MSSGGTTDGASSPPPRQAAGTGRWRSLARATMVPVRTFQASARTPLLQVLKTAAAAVIAWIACSFVASDEPPIFGAIAAIIVVQPSINQSFSRAVERSIGVIVGVVVAYLVALLFGAPSWLILAAIVISLLVGWALRFPQSSTVQIPISAMLVLSVGAQTPGYAVERIVETVIGAIIGVFVNWLIVPPLAVQPAHDAVATLGREVAAIMDKLASVLSEPTDERYRTLLLVEARLLRPMQTKALATLETAEDSLRFNPRRSAHRDVLKTDAALMTMLGTVITRVLGMTRAVKDHFDEGLRSEPVAVSIAEELRRAAHDLRLVMENVALPTGEEERLSNPEPALTAPIQTISPDPSHWILIGSLLEDLRRVREEIVGAVDDLH
ncbi:aromatic acid exporter family protein [Herbiconiux sp. UC225_62]|uniref:FUSC family protein n=1 Tax=Herbiconiux sp. UC225_62 TaxID=3350168 RepID=UPI0036D39389